jgi:archaemetzincin
MSFILFSQIKTINVLPLGNVPQDELESVKTSITNFYGFKCVILKPVKLNSDLLSPSKKRYSADKILKNFNGVNRTIVITSVDITTEKNGSKEWGIFGLGYMPGNVCVVSTKRIKKGVSNYTFKDRFEKVILHEIGHNLGLPHCNKNIHCMMNDAKGTSSQVDNEKIWLCDNCKNKLKK